MTAPEGKDQLASALDKADFLELFDRVPGQCVLDVTELARRCHFPPLVSGGTTTKHLLQLRAWVDQWIKEWLEGQLL